MKKPVIFFDWDGTLCDSMALCVQENRTALKRMGLPEQPEHVLRQCNGPTYVQGAALLGVPEERVAEYCRVRLESALALVPAANRMYHGAREMLLTLKERAALCIVSNASAEYLTLCLRTFGLEGVFTRVEAARPDRTKAQNIAALLAELTPEQAVMVGDRLGDIASGQENGLPTIACDYGYGSTEELAEADVHVDSVAELEAVLLQRCGDK